MASLVELSELLIAQILSQNNFSVRGDGPGPDTLAIRSQVFDKGFVPVDHSNKIPIQGQINNSFQDGFKGGNLYDDGGPRIGARGGPYASFPASLRNFDIFAVANWLRNIARETGILPSVNNNNGPTKIERTAESITKGITFLSSQFLLTSLNPGGLPIPGTADRQVFTNINPLNAVYNPLSSITAAIPLMRGTSLTSITVGGLVSDYKTDLQTRLATNSDAMGLYEQASLLLDKIPELPPSYPLGDAPGINPSTTDVGFNAFDEAYGAVPATIDDSSIYLPLMFQDLRNPIDEFLYFRAFLKPGYTETFTPDWQLDRYYGRAEQVPTYMGTSRNIDLSFDLVAWGPNDLKVLYKKLQKLQAMVYPFYDTKGFLESGPIIRMRVGDLFAADENKGLPGYITSMNLSFEDGIWNIKNNERVPRFITVSIAFTVLHEGNPGTYPFQSEVLNAAGDVILSTPGQTFGAGTFETDSDGTTVVTVKTANIRKIFGSVK